MVRRLTRSPTACVALSPTQEYAASAGRGLIRINPSAAECGKTQCEHTKRWLDTEYFPLVERSNTGLRALCRELGLPTD